MLLTVNKLFISFVTSEFSTKIGLSHLQATADLVFHWMSSYLLSLNQSKTKFLLISLHAQLPKISSPMLMPYNAVITPTSSTRYLGVIFDSTFLIFHVPSVTLRASFKVSIHSKIQQRIEYRPKSEIYRIGIQYSSVRTTFWSAQYLVQLVISTTCSSDIITAM